MIKRCSCGRWIVFCTRHGVWEHRYLNEASEDAATGKGDDR